MRRWERKASDLVALQRRIVVPVVLVTDYADVRRVHLVRMAR